MIVGRESELESLRAFVCAEDGDAVLALIEGEAGIGKTALWTAAAEHARAAGATVLVARPSAAETASSYAALDDLVRPVLDRLQSVPELSRRALAAALLLEPSPGPPDVRAVAHGLLELLGNLAPVVVTIDDWQWLDGASGEVLRFAVRRLPEGVRVMATVRTGVSDEAVAALVRELPDGGALELTVGPLGRDALREIVAARVGVALSPPALARLEEAARGNVLTAIELARAEHDPGRANAIDIRRLLGARVAALPERARDVLRAVAALSAATDDLVARTVGESGLEAALVADVIERDGERLRCSHPLLAVAVQDRTPLPAWRALHRRLAEVVDDIEQRARHLAEAAEAPDAATAAALDAAAEAAVARGAPIVAADLAERAGRLTPATEPDARLRRLLAASDMLVMCGDGDRAHSMLGALIAELPAGPRRAQALYRIALIGRDLELDAQLATQALDEAGDDDALRAEIYLVLAGCSISGGVRAIIPYADRALEHAERAGDPGVLARCLSEVAFHRYSLGHGVQRDVLAKAAVLEEVAGVSRSPMSAVPTLVLQLALNGPFDEARPLLARELEDAVRTGNADVEAGLRMAATELEVRSGRLAEADAHAQRMLDLSVTTGISNYESAGRWVRALADVHLGRVEQAREQGELALGLAHDLDDRIFVVNIERVLGLLELSLGDAAAALRRLAPLPREEAALDIGEPMIFQLHADLAEALVLTGDLDAAAAAQAQLERHPAREWAVGTALRSRGLIRSAKGRHDEAIADHHAALRVLETAGQPLEHARTLLALGAAQRRAKHRSAARRSLESALAVFETIGAALWAERARAEIARLGGRRTADRDELTESERRIAELAAAGRPNRDIAAALFVSERTVESNLTRAYRKLGVRSRTELARRLPS